jgi:signal-transduction protein with cAMP-binding, CBS, and nucleotidyltransferase domain
LTPERVSDIASGRPLVVIRGDSSAQEVAKRMAEAKVSAVVIEDSGRPVGILTERDLARQVCAKDLVASKTPATAIMSAPVVAVDERATIEDAAGLMMKNRLRHLAVERDGKIAGMITATDLARYLGRMAVKEKGEGNEQLSNVLAAFFPYEEPWEELT